MPHTPPLSVFSFPEIRRTMQALLIPGNPDYYPAGILCPGGHSENGAMAHWCWILDYYPFGMLKPHRHWNLPDEDNTYTSYYFDKPLDIDFFSDCGQWTTFGKGASVTCYTNYGSMMVSTQVIGAGAYIELDTEIDSTYVLKIYITGYTTNSTWQVSARDNQGSIIESATVTTTGEISFEFKATTSTSRVYIVRTGGNTSSTININQLSVTGKYPKKEELYLSYRYGFNNMEKDDELKGTGNSYDFGARIYDPRIGRWLAVDPLAGKYPDLSPYNFVANSPLLFVDPDGRKIKIVWRDEGGKKHKALITNREEYDAWSGSINDNSGKFANAVNIGLDKISSFDDLGVLDAAIYNKKTLKIKHTDESDETAYRKGNTLNWNYKSIYISGKGEKQAPIVSLYHDMAEWVTENINSYTSENMSYGDLVRKTKVEYENSIKSQKGSYYDSNILMIKHFEPGFIENLNKSLSAEDEPSQARSEYYDSSGKVEKGGDILSTKPKKDED